MRFEESEYSFPVLCVFNVATMIKILDEKDMGKFIIVVPDGFLDHWNHYFPILISDIDAVPISSLESIKY